MRTQELLRAIEALRLANRHLRRGDVLRQTLSYVTLSNENWARRRTWADGLADDPHCEDVDPAIRTPAQEVLVPLSALRRIAASAETPAEVSAKIGVLLQEKLFIVRSPSSDELEHVNRYRGSDENLELSTEFRPIDDELLDELHKLARRAASMGGTPQGGMVGALWWRRYELQVARLVRGRFDECGRHIASVESDYWERFRTCKQVQEEMEAFVQSLAPPGASHGQCAELRAQWLAENGPSDRPNLLEHPLTVAGAWTLLAAIYDLCAAEAGTMALIKSEHGPSHVEEEHERLAGFYFEILKSSIRDHEESYRLLIDEALEIAANDPAEAAGDRPASEHADEDEAAKAEAGTGKEKKRKRSTAPGEGRAKLIPALTKHHKYSDGGCLNFEAIGNNELARLAKVEESTASAFFKKEFGSWANYRAMCADESKLLAALKLLNGEYSPHILFGSVPPSEQERDDE